MRGISAVGSAPHWQCGGHGFESRMLHALSISLNINPVTIPREWGIKHIPNLLNAYFDKVQEEQDLKETERFRDECLKEILANKKERARLFSSH